MNREHTGDERGGHAQRPEQCLCRTCTQNILDRGHSQMEEVHRKDGHEIVLHWLNNLVESKKVVAPTPCDLVAPNLPGWSQTILENIEKNWLRGQQSFADRQKAAT